MAARTKIVAVAFALLLGMVAALFLVPQALRVEVVKTKIAGQIGEKLGSPVVIGEIRWGWLPLPHLTVRDAAVDHPGFQLDLPEARLYPSWKALLTGESGVSVVVLNAPRAVFKVSGPRAAGSTLPLLPEIEVKVKRGRLTVEAAQGVLPGLASRQIVFKELSGRVKLKGDRLTWDLESVPSFADGLATSGFYLFADGSYGGRMKLERAALHQLVPPLVGGDIRLADSLVSIKVEGEGRGRKRFAGRVSGEFPCFLYQREDRRQVVDCGFAELEVDYGDDRLKIKIDSLELKEPHLAVKGVVEAAPLLGGETVWGIDLAAEEIDLAQVRRALLAVFPGHSVVQRVTAIVRAGSVVRGRYRFNGTGAGFAHLEMMTITARVEDAAIHVPHAELDLQGVGGDLSIAGGVLEVARAHALLGNSRARDATLLLGLLTGDNRFNLDLSIDADLTDLAPILARLVPSEPFRAELARVHGIEGKASGRLSIGGSLHRPVVEVRVDHFAGRAEPERFPWPVSASGALAVTPGRLDLSRATIELGPHLFRGVEGSLNWQGSPSFTIRRGSADLDGGAVIKDVSTIPTARESLRRVVADADGEIHLAGIRASGPISDPAAWRYSFQAGIKDGWFESPLLGARVAGIKGSLVASDQRIDKVDIEGVFLDSPFVLSGSVDLRSFGVTGGSLGLSALLSPTIEPWIKQRGVLPPPLLPRFPARIKGATVSWSQEGVALSGSMLAGKGGGPPAEITFLVKRNNRDPLSAAVEVSGGDESAQLVVDLLDNLPGTILVGFKGRVSGKTMARLFADTTFLRGAIEGECSFLLPERAEEVAMKGHLVAHGLRWEFEGARTVELQEVRLSGAANKVLLERLSLEIAEGEILELSGEMAAEGDVVNLDLDLGSARLSRTALREFVDNIERLKPGKGARTPSRWSLSGSVDFFLEEFVSGPPPQGGEEETLVWKPIAGRVVLGAKGIRRVEILSASLCCLETTGTWFPVDAGTDGTFAISSGCESPRFEEVLPCLGLGRELLVGPFSLEAELSGSLESWKSGSVRVDSQGGRILRLTLLSKIFSLINITGIFSGSLPGFDDRQGFGYSQLEFAATIKDNQLAIDKAVVKGEGLNFFARGKLDLATWSTDMVVLVAPFKTLDVLVSKIPLISQVFGGENAAVVTIPVGVKGDIRDPSVTLLPPEAVGEGLLNLVTNTLSLPFRILSPLIPKGAGEEGPAAEKEKAR